MKLVCSNDQLVIQPLGRGQLAPQMLIGAFRPDARTSLLKDVTIHCIVSQIFVSTPYPRSSLTTLTYYASGLPAII